jgi:hypothetical protein
MGDDGPVNPYAPPKNESIGLLEEKGDSPRTAGGGGGFIAKDKSAWTTVASFGNVQKAVEALRLLEKAKIECRVLNDGAVDASISLHWVRSMPLGGHRVQVHARDLTEAAALLGVSLERDEYEDAAPNPADERMKKAFFAAVVGTFLCPGVAHLIALVLVLATPGKLLSAIGRTRRLWASVISVVILGGLLLAALTDAPPSPGDEIRRKVAPYRETR